MKKSIVIIFTLFLVFLIGCQNTATPINSGESPANSQATATYTSISQKEAKEKIDNEDVIILDVREQSEFDEGHLPNALLIPLGTLQKNAESMLPDKNAQILVYCRSGNRSKQGSEILVGLGYTNIYEIGGINTWPYEIVK
ncbi:MAG: rhodanese-like domain-containing protein [Clostridia bacterium]|nr:rhodanese-like domain-containing protein [Clostridia bacterium]